MSISGIIQKRQKIPKGAFKLKFENKQFHGKKKNKRRQATVFKTQHRKLLTEHNPTRLKTGGDLEGVACV